MPCCYGTNEEVRYWGQFGNELCVCSRLIACPKQEEPRKKMGNAGSTRDVKAPGCLPLGTSTGPGLWMAGKCALLLSAISM